MASTGRGARSSGWRTSIASPSWQIRRFVMADYDQVLSLWQGAGRGVEIRPSDTPEGLALKLARDADLFLVASSGSQVIGVVMGAWDGRRGWVHHLTVHPDFRREGVASSMMAEVEARLMQRGCLKINLLVREANREGMALYRSLGYGDMTGICAMGKELGG